MTRYYSIDDAAKPWLPTSCSAKRIPDEIALSAALVLGGQIGRGLFGSPGARDDGGEIARILSRDAFEVRPRVGADRGLNQSDHCEFRERPMLLMRFDPLRELDRPALKSAPTDSADEGRQTIQPGSGQQQAVDA
ncbi:hypothetical protein ACTWP6_28335 [Mycobacterium sp. 4D054]|uniref:hypothetical protein n=1 Tax=Mycobacterium sp. 4D054 TaxID=3457440 RepID=UPI003FD639D5